VRKVTIINYYKKALNYLLKETGILGVQVCRDLDLAPTYLSAALRGTYWLRLDVEQKVAEYFGLTHLELLNLGAELSANRSKFKKRA